MPTQTTPTMKATHNTKIRKAAPPEGEPPDAPRIATRTRAMTRYRAMTAPA